MKRLGMVMLLALAVLAVSVAPALATAVNYKLNVMGDNQLPVTNATCRVNTAGANTLFTIYTTQTLATAAANPLAVDTTTGTCSFWIDDSTTAVDIIISVPTGPYKGAHARVDNVTRTGQKTVLLNRSSALKKLSVRFSATASTSTTTATETLPAGARVLAAILETTAAVAASTFNVNVAGVQGSLCSAVTTAAVGFAACNMDGNAGSVVTASSAITYHNQNHASAGFAHVFYLEPANEP